MHRERGSISNKAGEADKSKIIKVGDAMLRGLGFILKSLVCHGSSLSGCSAESGGTSDLIRFVLFKDHSVPSVKSGLEGGGYRLEAWRIVWRWYRYPGDNWEGPE